MAFPNVSHIHNWELVFSNFPTITKESDLRYLHNYIKDFALPNYTNPEVTSNLMGSVIRHPIAHNNMDLQTITVSFIASEDLQNYLFFLEFMMNIKYGNVEAKSILRKICINALSLRVFDNEKRDIARIDFSRLFVTDLSGFNFNYQDSAENTFTATFSYEEIKFERISI